MWSESTKKTAALAFTQKLYMHINSIVWILNLSSHIHNTKGLTGYGLQYKAESIQKPQVNT